MLKSRRLSAVLVAAGLVIGLAATPAADAAQSSSTKARSSQKAKSAATASVESLRKRTVEAEEDIRGLDKGVKWLSDLSKRNENSVKFLTAAAPQLVSGLTQLRDASLQLKAGLEMAGAGLTRLGEAYTSVEYGAIRLYEGPVGTAPNNFEEIDSIPAVTSSDIPDDGNTSLIAASIPYQAAGATDIAIRGTIRSNEIEPGVSQGQMGGILYAKCVSPPTIGGVCAGGAVQAGSLVCQVGPPDEKSFAKPGGSTDQTLMDVTDPAPRTDADRPNVYDDSPTGDRDDVCRLPGPGVYELTVSAQFADIPDTATPGPRE